MTGRSALGADVDELVVERALVDRARTDPAAFAQLYRRHVDAVHGFAYRRSGSRDVAEEATSATFEKALRGIGTFEWRDAGLRPWLLRIASNEVAEIHRRRSRTTGERGQIALRALAPDERAGDWPGAGDAPTIDLASMHAALSRLPERYRAAISLRHLAGLSPADAASELDCSTAVLAVTLHRAMKALRREMGASIDDDGGGGR